MGIRVECSRCEAEIDIKTVEVIPATGECESCGKKVKLKIIKDSILDFKD